jgi:hypothetical protein
MDKPCKDSWRATNKRGYHTCLTSFNGQTHYLYHRLVFAKTYNHTFKPGELIRHTCDNPWCVEPTHLLLGTDADNAKDRRDRKRCGWGDKQPATILTESDVREIRSLYEAGWAQIELAKEFDVSKSCIAKIVLRLRWKHID